MTISGLWEFLVLLGVIGGSGLVLRMAPGVPDRWRVPASLAVVLAFLVIAPFILDEYRTGQLTRIGIWIVVAMGLNILSGYNGQVSLGHGALMALGAYTAAILMDGTEQMSFVDASPWPFWLAIVMAGIVTAIVGLFLGIPALRLSGPYLAIATLALAISFPSVMKKYSQFTGGSLGLRISPIQPPDFLGGALERFEYLYFLSLICAVLMLLLAWVILRGPLGRAFVAVRDSEIAAEAMGINIARTKVTAFAISAFFAGIGGGLYVQVVSTVSPESIQILQSVTLLASIVIGGLASILGSVIGAVALVLLPTEGPRLVGQVPGLNVDIVESAPGAIQGVIVVAVVLLLPGGAAAFVHGIMRLTPSDVLSGLRALPGELQARAADLRERISWAWDIRPPAAKAARGQGASDGEERSERPP